MKIHTVGLTAALCVIGVAVGLAADPQLGTWKLNEASSKLKGTARNHTVVYAESGDNVTITIDGVDESGKAYKSEWTGKFDGKDYPVTGDATSDVRQYIRANPNRLNFVSKLAGKVTLAGSVTVSADGKSRTVNATGTDAKGKKVAQTSVYDKQ
jgi:hypothetical protein